MFDQKMIVFVGYKGAGKDTAAEFLISMGYEPIKFAGGLKYMLQRALERRMLKPDKIHHLIEGRAKEDPYWGLTPEFLSEKVTLEVMLDALIEYQGMPRADLLRNKDRLGGRDIPIKELAFKSYNEALFLLRHRWVYHLTKNCRSEKDPISPRHVMITLGTEWGRNEIDQDIWYNVSMRRADNFEYTVFTDGRFQNEIEGATERGAFVIQIDAPGVVPDLSHPSEQWASFVKPHAKVTNYRSDKSRLWKDVGDTLLKHSS